MSTQCTSSPSHWGLDRPRAVILLMKWGIFILRIFFKKSNFSEIEAEEAQTFHLLLRLIEIVFPLVLGIWAWFYFFDDNIFFQLRTLLRFRTTLFVEWNKISKFSVREWSRKGWRVFSFGWELALEWH